MKAVQYYSGDLRSAAVAGGAQPSKSIIYHIRVDEAPEQYEQLGTDEAGVRKIAIRFE